MTVVLSSVVEPLTRLGLQGALRKYGWALLAPAATLSAALLLNAVASRALGTAGFGTFSVGVATLTLLGMAMGAGLPTTLVRFASLAPDASGARRRVWRLAGVTALAGALVFMAWLWLAPSLASQWVPRKSEPWIVVGGLGVVMLELSAAEAQLRHRYDRYFWILVANSVLRLIGVAVGVGLGGGGPVAALRGYAFASFAGALLMSLPALRTAARATATPTPGKLEQMIRYALPVGASTLIVAAIMNADALLLALTLTPREVGMYAAGSRLTTLQSTLIAGLTVIALPTATRALAEGRLQQFARQAGLIGALIGILVTATAMLLSSWLVWVVYGVEYREAAPVFAILSLSLLPNFVGNLTVQVLYASGSPHVILLVHFALLLALLAGMPVAASAWGIVGAAWYRAGVNIAAVLILIYLSLAAAERSGDATRPVEARP